MKPWEVDRVPEEFLDAFDAFDSVARRLKQAKANEKFFVDFRKRLKYRNY